ncbi:MAG: acyl-CoA dehydrogenase family protein [bacterium]
MDRHQPRRDQRRAAHGAARRLADRDRGVYAAREDISLIKFTVARTLQRVLDRAIQTLGGLGVTDDTPLAFWWAHERAARIYDGADEVHIEVVARRILKRYGMKGRS